jgi:hypothetical protein
MDEAGNLARWLAQECQVIASCLAGVVFTEARLKTDRLCWVVVGFGFYPAEMHFNA